MQYQWYPGHMTKARRQMEENIKLVDIVIELCDSRIPLSSRNPDIDKIAGGKARLLILNKTDLSDEKINRQWKAYFENKGIRVVLLDARKKGGMKPVTDAIMECCQEKLERDKKKGLRPRPVRAMVVGIPNAGKSTFINSFAGKASTKTGDTPGVTKGLQWIRLNKQVELLDTPGILWPKFEDQMVAKKLAFIGSIGDTAFDEYTLACDLSRFLGQNAPKVVTARYGVEDPAGYAIGEELLEAIGRKRGHLKSGGVVDTERTATMLLNEFRAGKVGRITLEKPE